MYVKAAGNGWQFVPIPGVAPLPREVADDEYYPLHVGLFPDTYPNCKYSSYPHKHIRFMGMMALRAFGRRLSPSHSWIMY